MAFNTKDLSKDLAKQTTKIVVDAVANGGVNPTAVVKAIVDVGGLCWKAGVYIHHKSNVQKSLALCLEEYRAVGYLTTSMTDGDEKLMKWQTTPKFHVARIVLHAYPDIDRFLKEENFTQAELKGLGLDSELTIHADKAASKRLGDLNARISACCLRTGIKDLTKTDAEKRIANVSAMQMGAIILQNAFIAEGQRRERGEVAAVVPVLGRILGIMAICGITDIALSEIATLLGKAPIYETIARARIAKLRNAHASQVFNTLLFSGNTESIAKDFGNSAINFSGERLVVGRVKASKKSEFLPEYATFNCELSGPPDKKHTVGTPIYMVAGWANLIKQRESFEKQHSGFAQMAHIHAPVKATDCHGNTYMSAGKLPKIVFKVKELPNGTLMAKPRNFDRFDYKSGANFDKGSNRSKASGEEKLFGGIVGPPVCNCRGAPDTNKGQLINSWKLGSGIKISSRDFVGNSIAHTQQLSTKKIAILWRPGDWIMGAFLMQILPQSSYLQGRAECLHCAVENAALYGCAEVIACGGGRVSAEALATELSKPEPTVVVVAAEAPTFQHEKPEEELAENLLLSELAETPLLPNPTKTCPPILPLRTAKAETATALYDYEAQAAGDLSFSRGDVIEIVNRTQSEAGWWTGLTNGKQGLFPGNYVRLDPDTTYPPISPDSSSSPVLTRMMSTDSTPSSPPPAYGSMSPGPPPAGAEYFAISDAQGDKIVPRAVRRKPVGSGVTRKPLPATSPVLDAKIAVHAMEPEVNPWLIEPDAANRG